MLEELNTIEFCFKKQSSDYQKILEQQQSCLEEYSIYVNDYDGLLRSLFQSYESECAQFPSTSELKLHEKAACLAIAIKRNPYFFVKNHLGFNKYTYINSLFAVDVALKFCELNLPFELQKNFEQLSLNSDLQYTKVLLAKILEYKNVRAINISDNIKMEVDLLLSVLKSKSNIKK